MMRPRALAFAAVAAAVIALSMLADRPVAVFVSAHPFGGSMEFYVLCRLAGYVPTWMLVAGAFVLLDMRGGWRGIWARGGVLLTSVVASGGAAEALKMIVRRERPEAPFASYTFRSWAEEPWSSGGLGWPSSHVAVAMAGVCVLWRLYPRAWPVWLLIGAGGAWSRLAFNDHFLSDVAGAAVVAYVVAAGVAATRSAPRALP